MRCAPFVLCFALLATFVGCGLFPLQQEQTPSWVEQPNASAMSSRFISAVGVGAAAPTQSAKLFEAEHNAREELLTELRHYCDSALRQFLQRNSQLADPASNSVQDFVRAVSNEASNAILRQVARHETWHDSAKDAMCVLYRVPVSAVHSVIMEKANAALPRVNPFPAERETEALAALEACLNALLKERTAGAPASDETVAAETADAPPAWIAHGKHDDYPPEKFLCATGLGESIQTAQDNASRETALLIEAQMRDRARRSATVDDALGRNVGALALEALALRADDLPKVAMAEAWYDPVTNTYYALGAVNKASAAVDYAKRADAAVRQAKDVYISAANNHKADNYRTALEQYLHALTKMQPAVRLQLAASVLSASEDATAAARMAEVNLVEMKGKINDLLAELKLEKLGGDKQWAAPGVALRAPLVARLTGGTDGTPVLGLWLEYRFAAGSGHLQSPVQTGPDGAARCEVKGIDARSGPAGMIECALDLKRVAPDADLSALQIPKVTFSYVGRAAQNTQIALYVEERLADDQPAADRVVESAVRAALVDGRLNVIPPDALPDTVRRGGLEGDASDDRVVEVLGGALQSADSREKVFLLIIVGTARSEIVETRETSKGTLFFASTTVTLRVVDGSLPSDRTIFTVADTGKEVFTGDAGRAVSRSRLRAAGLASEKLVAALSERLGLDR